MCCVVTHSITCETTKSKNNMLSSSVQGVNTYTILHIFIQPVISFVHRTSRDTVFQVFFFLGKDGMPPGIFR